MTISLKFYTDAQLTQPLDTTQLAIDREIGGAPVDKQIYLGSATANRQFTAADSGPIIVSILDSDPINGFAATDIALSLTQAGLDSATAGADLTINGSITSGVANAVPVWLRFSGTSTSPKTSTDLALATNLIRETAT